MGDTLFFNDYVAVLENVTRTTDVAGISLGENDAAVKAQIRVLGKTRDYKIEPVFLIKDRMVGRVPETIEDLGLRITFLNVDPQTGSFTFSINTSQKDFIIVKALEKAFINVLWIGTAVVLIGFGIAMVRRYKEFAVVREREKEMA